MEQRISTDTPAIHPAGTDPAFVPGLTPPSPPGPPDEPRADRDTSDGVRNTPRDAEEERGEDAASQQDEAAVTGHDSVTAEGPAGDEATTDAEEETSDDGPSFTAFDLRGSITAKRSGVTLDMDGEEVDFDWEEIGAVQIDTSRLRRRLRVTVHTTGHVRYEAEVKAPSRHDVARWEAELDAVLDAYFDSGS